MGAGQAESAIDDLERTLGLAPTAPQVGEALFFAALATGDLRKAADAIEKVRARKAIPRWCGISMDCCSWRNSTTRRRREFVDMLKKEPGFRAGTDHLARVAGDAGQVGGGGEAAGDAAGQKSGSRAGTDDAGVSARADRPHAAGDRTGGKGPHSQPATCG